MTGSTSATARHSRRILAGVGVALFLGCLTGCGEPSFPQPGLLRGADGRVEIYYPTCGDELTGVRIDKYGTVGVLWQVASPTLASAKSGHVALGDDTSFSVVTHPAGAGKFPDKVNVEFDYRSSATGSTAGPGVRNASSSIDIAAVPTKSPGPGRYWQADVVGEKSVSRTAAELTHQICDRKT